MDFAYGQRYRDLYYKHWWWRVHEAAILDVLLHHYPLGG